MSLPPLLPPCQSFCTSFNYFQEGLFRVSPSAIDEIIMSHASQKKESSYVLYLLRLDAPGNNPTLFDCSLLNRRTQVLLMPCLSCAWLDLYTIALECGLHRFILNYPLGGHHYYNHSDSCGAVGWIGVTERSVCMHCSDRQIQPHIGLLSHPIFTL